MNTLRLTHITIRYTNNIAVVFYSSTYSRGYITIRCTNSSTSPIDLAVDVLIGRRDTDSIYNTNTVFTLNNYMNSLEDTQPIINVA